MYSHRGYYMEMRLMLRPLYPDRWTCPASLSGLCEAEGKFLFPPGIRF
jgi:hypothetical protein